MRCITRGRPPLHRSTELTTKSPPCEGGERGVVISSMITGIYMNLRVDMLSFFLGKGKNKSEVEVRFGRLDKVKEKGELFRIK